MHQDIVEASERGWKLIPLVGEIVGMVDVNGKPKGPKAAILSDWPKRATSDLDQLQAWALEFPLCWWGVLTGETLEGGSGFDVVDVDNLAAWKELIEKNPTEFEGRAVKTASGKFHYYFQPHGTGSKPDPFGIGGHLVELRGKGGYIVMPPSGFGPHAGADANKAYSWWGSDDIPEMPTWMQAAIDSSASSKEQRRKDRERQEPFQEGERNTYLLRESGRLARVGLGEVAIEAALEAFRSDPAIMVPGDTTNIHRLAVTAVEKYGDGAELNISESELKHILGFVPDEVGDWNSRGSASINDFLRAIDRAGIGTMLQVNMLTGGVLLGEHAITDQQYEAVHLLLNSAGYKSAENLRSAVENASARRPFHPILSWWESRPWDGKDHIFELSRFFVDKHDQFDTWLRRWCIGSVARMLEKGGAQNRMLVLDGTQGIGKSYLARWLAGPMTQYYREGGIDADSTDAKLRLLDTWINEVGELGATFRKSDRDALKFFLTVQHVKERRPYAHYDTGGTARTSFIGTLNNEGGFLTDPTGNRRYFISSFTNIDWGYSEEVDVQQVWAQALALYRDNEPWDLLRDEVREADRINTEYESGDPLQDDLLGLLEFDKSNADWTVPKTEVRMLVETHLHGRGLGKITDNRVGKAMRRLGAFVNSEYNETTKGTERVWVGVKIRSRP